MSEVLTQDEIDQLLTAINPGDSPDFISAPLTPAEKKANIKKFLTRRFTAREKPYGIFEADVSICRFFDTQGAEEILADIERKNREQGVGNYQIPGTNIKLINYSHCEKCGAIFSFKDVREYYAKPRPDPMFANSDHQHRNDTRMFCRACGTYFLPALVIVDGTPKNETQLLCRMQTVEAIEKHYAKKDRRVLTATKRNIVNLGGGNNAILNDVLLDEMQERPTLISNLINYTPMHLAMNLLDGTNVGKKDFLFDQMNWKVRQ